MLSLAIELAFAPTERSEFIPGREIRSRELAADDQREFPDGIADRGADHVDAIVWRVACFTLARQRGTAGSMQKPFHPASARHDVLLKSYPL